MPLTFYGRRASGAAWTAYSSIWACPAISWTFGSGVFPTTTLYYYALPVKPDETTGELLGVVGGKKEKIVLDVVTKDVTDQASGVTITYTYYQVVEIMAEAIQSVPDKAVEDSWKVVVDDSTHHITQVNP